MPATPETRTQLAVAYEERARNFAEGCGARDGLNDCQGREICCFEDGDARNIQRRMMRVLDREYPKPRCNAAPETRSSRTTRHAEKFSHHVSPILPVHRGRCKAPQAVS